VAHVLAVAALEQRDPMAFVIEGEPGDAPIHLYSTSRSGAFAAGAGASGAATGCVAGGSGVNPAGWVPLMNASVTPFGSVTKTMLPGASNRGGARRLPRVLMYARM